MDILTIDIGGTMIKSGVIDRNGTIISRGNFPMPAAYEQLTAHLIDHIEQHYGRMFDGIAISSTGLVDPETQEIGIGSVLYEAFGQSLVKELARYFHIPVSAENDGNCALLAEKWLGNGKKCKDFATIVLGTSVGGALMINHQLVRGKHLVAGEFGYMLYPSDPKPWEIWSLVGSTRVLVEEVSQKFGKPLDGHQVAALFEAGDTQTQASVDIFIEKLAVGCYSLQYMVDPEKILIGGGISKSDFLLPALQREINRLAATIPSNIIVPQVEACLFGNDSNLIGACYYFLNKFEIKGKAK
ncbi:ROK family protein [Enterococcus sp.]|uniref:ROK family protein n=1 Tax=Enterococcus sp. TaxID=35783 RepID=UPI00289E32D2|nr:ROK family protein [Enterococcus sp.]